MQQVWQILKHGSTLTLILMALVGCNHIKQMENRGYFATNPIESQIEVGKTTKDDVVSRLGTPSTVSDFPPEAWYYISRDTETIAFLAPKLTDQKIARIEFDPNGVVNKFEMVGKAKSRKVDYVNRVTPTEGRKLGLAEQLLGNVGRFNTPKDASEARQ